MLEDLQAVANRQKESLTLELQLAQIREHLHHLGDVVINSDRCGVGFGGAARGDVVVSGSLEARRATARFGVVMGLRTSITRAQRESTRILGRMSKRPKKTSCAGTVSWETAAPSGVLVPKVSPPYIFNVSIGKIRTILTPLEIGEI